MRYHSITFYITDNHPFSLRGKEQNDDNIDEVDDVDVDVDVDNHNSDDDTDEWLLCQKVQPICQQLDEGSVSQLNLKRLSLLKNQTHNLSSDDHDCDENTTEMIVAKNPLFRRLDHCVETKGSDNISWHGTY